MPRSAPAQSVRGADDMHTGCGQLRAPLVRHGVHTLLRAAVRLPHYLTIGTFVPSSSCILMSSISVSPRSATTESVVPRSSRRLKQCAASQGILFAFIFKNHFYLPRQSFRSSKSSLQMKPHVKVPAQEFHVDRTLPAKQRQGFCVDFRRPHPSATAPPACSAGARAAPAAAPGRREI